MKTILYATDYSKNAQLALKYAYNLSQKMEAKLLVLHVFDYPTLLDDLSLKGTAAFPDIEGDTLEKHNLKLEEFCTTVLGKDISDVEISLEAIENKSVVNGIIEKAKETKAQFIIIGTKGLSAWRELIMGSTAKHLIEKAPCPVLTVPSDSVKMNIEVIVYAADFQEEDFGALNKLSEIARPFNAQINIVHMAEIDETVEKEYKTSLENKIRKHVDYPHLKLDILYTDDIYNALKIYFRDSNADLMAMLERQGNGFFAKSFHRDLVKRMESYGKIPLLSLNAKHYGIFHFEN